MPPSTKIVVPSIGKIASLGELFLFNVQHALFLTGRSKYIQPYSYSRALFAPGLLMIILIGIGVLQPAILPYMLIISVLVAIAAWFACDSVARTRKLCEEGKLIQGRIVDYQTGKSLASYSRFNLIAGREMSYINALCGFRTPDGKTLQKRIKIVFDDSFDNPAREGSPIAVLYLNEQIYRVL